MYPTGHWRDTEIQSVSFVVEVFDQQLIFPFLKRENYDFFLILVLRWK